MYPPQFGDSDPFLSLNQRNAKVSRCLIFLTLPPTFALNDRNTLGGHHCCLLKKNGKKKKKPGRKGSNRKEEVKSGRFFLLAPVDFC